MKTQWLRYHATQICLNCKRQFVYSTVKHECSAKTVSESKIVCKGCWHELATGSLTWAEMYG